MSSTKGFRLFTFVLVSAMLLAMAVPAAFAEEKAAAAHAGPDLTVMLGSTGGKVGNINVYLDGKLAGKTDWKGNFTFKEAPSAGNHTVLVSAKDLKNVTIDTSFAEKPVVIKTEMSKGNNMTIHVTDKTGKQGIAGVSVINGDYKMGETDASGDLAIKNCPAGIYLIKLEKDGYKSTTTLLIVYSNRTQNFSLTPAK
jgi:hypothetical protein